MILLILIGLIAGILPSALKARKKDYIKWIKLSGIISILMIAINMFDPSEEKLLLAVGISIYMAAYIAFNDYLKLKATKVELIILIVILEMYTFKQFSSYYLIREISLFMLFLYFMVIIMETPTTRIPNYIAYLSATILFGIYSIYISLFTYLKPLEYLLAGYFISKIFASWNSVPVIKLLRKQKEYFVLKLYKLDYVVILLALVLNVFYSSYLMAGLTIIGTRLYARTHF